MKEQRRVTTKSQQIIQHFKTHRENTMTKCNTNRGKSKRGHNDELQQNQDHGTNNQQSTTPEGNNNNNNNNNNKQDVDDDRKQKHGTNTRVTPGLTMNKTQRQISCVIAVL
jgi:hypothetical protein